MSASKRLTCCDSAARHGRRGVPGPLRGLAEGLQAGQGAAAASQVRHVAGLVLRLPLRLAQRSRQVLRGRWREPSS